MSEVVTFVDYQPPQRFDSTPWTHVHVEECATEGGVYALLEAIPLSPLDADPSNPAFRSFTTEQGTAIDYWYRIVWADADGDVSQPTSPVQNSAGSDPSPTVYATVEELQQLLQKDNPTTIEQTRMERCLRMAAAKIDWELGYSASNPSPYPPHPLVVEVNLDAAVEYWRQAPRGFGIAVIDQEPIVTARDSWYRHHLKLRPLKVHEGIA